MIVRSFAVLQTVWPFSGLAPRTQATRWEPVPQEKQQGQALMIQAWARQRRLTVVRPGSWKGRMGRFDVVLRTWMRGAGVLPMEIEVHRLFATDLPQDRATFSVTSGWAPLFIYLPKLEHIRLLPHGRVGAAFRFRWNTTPQTLDTLFVLLEERFSVAQGTYRSGD